jgi:hypothetical protein
VIKADNRTHEERERDRLRAEECAALFKKYPGVADCDTARFLENVLYGSAQDVNKEWKTLNEFQDAVQGLFDSVFGPTPEPVAEPQMRPNRGNKPILGPGSNRSNNRPTRR